LFSRLQEGCDYPKSLKDDSFSSQAMLCESTFANTVKSVIIHSDENIPFMPLFGAFLIHKILIYPVTEAVDPTP
jgi:hypothetical protein